MPGIPAFDVVDDPVAEDTWSYVDADGKETRSRIVIGRPRPWPDNPHGDWICPVEIEHFTDGVRAIVGVGPLDALMNAIGVVKAFADTIGKFTPRSTV
jgi:hypothetical protein